MAFSAKVGNFIKPASNAVPFDVVVTGVGFLPKAVIVWTSGNTTIGDDTRHAMGWATCPSCQRSIGWASSGSVTTTNAARVDDDQNLLRFITEGGADSSVCSLKSFDSDGFTVTFTTSSATGTYPIHYIALGGADILDYQVGTINTPATTGNQDITTPGFPPDMVFLMSTGAGSTPNIFSNTGARMGFGMASSNAQRATISTSTRDGLTTSDAGKKDRTDKAFHLLEVVGNVTSTSVEADMTLKLFNGFRLNYTAVPATSIPIFYLAIQGGGWDVGTFNAATATGNQTITTPFQPKLVMLGSTQTATANSNATNAAFTLGSASASGTTATSATWYMDTDAVSPTIGNRASSTTKILRQFTANATPANAVLQRECTLGSMNAGNFVLNWTTVTSPATVMLHRVVAGDTPTPTGVTLTHTCIAKYDKRITVSNSCIAKYNIGGIVNVGPIVHSYNILGPITHTAVIKYDKRAFVKNTCIIKYNKASVTQTCIIKYDKKAPITHSCTIRYNIEEDPSLNLRRYLRPYGIRIFIMSHDQRETYHMFDSFNPGESSIRVQQCTTNLAIDEAGSFSITVEDSGHGIDTSEVGEGNSVLIQAAKTPDDMGNGKHTVMFGYVTTKEVVRQNTGELKYIFSGAGSMIRFNERITNFSRSARRIKHDSPEPDRSDPDMVAWKLFRDVLTDTSQMPNGGPLESQFTMKGVTEVEPKVDAFIATMDNELVEWSEPMDYVADSTGATWGVNFNPDLNDIFLRYATLEPTNIVIKSGSDTDDPDDDRFNTAYILGDWGFTDSRDKTQGFSNHFYVRVGTKKVTANVISVQEIIDQYTPLAVNEPPTDPDAGQQLPENMTAAFGPIINLRTDLIGPFSPTWTSIANISREFDLNRTHLVMKFGTGTDGAGPAIGIPDWVTPWNTLTSGNVRLLGYVDTQNGTRTVSSVQEEIDRWDTTWGPYGIFFENVTDDPGKFTYYENLAAYAHSLGYQRVVANLKSEPGGTFMSSCPSVNYFVVKEGAGRLPNHEEELVRGTESTGPPGRRCVFAHSITTAVASDDDVAQWVSDLEFFDTGSYFYVTDDTLPQPYDVLSTRLRASMFGAEQAAIRILQDNGFIIPGIPVQQDLAMSFQAETQNLSDMAIIVSKIGNPIPESNEGPHLYLEVIADRTVVTTEPDPTTGLPVTTTTNMPNFTQPIAKAKIPFENIQSEFPTVIFLHRFIQRSQDIAVGQRYWLVMYGRGQNEENTIRWHHANASEALDYLAARRVPAAFRYQSETQRQQWQVFTKTTHPGFAFSYFKNTTHMLEAADSDSIERFGLVESDIDLQGVDDDAVAVRTMQAILQFSAKPKREYRLPAVTVPDDLILPGQLVRVYDSMTLSGQIAGSTAEGTEAEILSVSYEWDAYSHPMGCYTANIDAVGHVDFAYAYWLGKYKRGEISVQFPTITPKPPGPLPNNNAPIVYAQPKGSIFTTALKVSFSVNKTGVKVFYTTNGTVPVITTSGLPGTENNTRVYIPGTTAAIPINATTTLKFIGMDTQGRQSTVYTEEYTLKGSVAVGGSKIMFMPYWQGPTASQINNVFWLYMNSSLDYVTYHKRTTESYDTSFQNGALGTPSKAQEMEFEGYDEMVTNIATAKAAGFDIIGYNIESDERYPKADAKDVIGFCKKFSEYVRKQGLKVKFNPSPQFTETYGSRIVQYCDFYNIQCQYEQHLPDGFRTWVRNRTQSIRANNVNAIISITLSADLVEHQSVPGQTRLQTLQNRWTYAKDYVDGVRIFYQNNTELTTIVGPFMQWFTSSGRAV